MNDAELNNIGHLRLEKLQEKVETGIKICKSQKSLAKQMGVSTSAIQRIAAQNWDNVSLKIFSQIEENIEEILENLSARAKNIFQTIFIQKDLVRIRPFFKYLEKSDKSFEIWGTASYDKQLEIWEEEIYPNMETARQATYGNFPYFPILAIRLSGRAFLNVLAPEQYQQILEYCKFAIELVENKWPLEIEKSRDLYLKERVSSGLYNNTAILMKLCFQQSFRTPENKDPIVQEVKKLLVKATQKAIGPDILIPAIAQTALTIADEIRDFTWGEEIWQKISNNFSPLPQTIIEDLNNPEELQFLKAKGLF